MARGKLNRGQQAERQVRVGLLMIVSIIVLAMGIFQVGRLFDVFASRYPLVTLVKGSGGLIPGSLVTLAGQRVGQVEELRFLPVETRSDSANIYIRLSVNRSVAEQIRGDSRASIQTQGLLGDRFVEITPGSVEYAQLEPGDTIPSLATIDYESVLRTAVTTLDDVRAVVVDLRTITDDLAGGRGTLGALLADDVLYERMAVATTELAGLLQAINRSDGTMARIIRDPTLYDRLNGSLARLDSLGGLMLDGEGSLGRLMHDDSLYTGLLDVVARTDSTLVGLEGLVTRVGEGEGTFAKLMEDPQLYDEFLRTIVDLQALIQTIREDPSLLRPEVRVF